MRIPDLGGRGGGWVVGQFLLIAAVAAVAVAGSRWAPPNPGVQLAGAALGVLGAALAMWAAVSLGGALVPWPKPVGDEVVQRGPYAVVRHPIYSGGLLMCLGAAGAGGWPVLLPTAALAVWWALKCRVEERMLRQRFPRYAEYCDDVRWRMVPGLY